MNEFRVTGKMLSWFAALLMITFVAGGCGSDSDTAAVSPDTTPPAITSGPSVTSVTDNSAVVSWTTDEEATSLVRYGTTLAYGSHAGPEGSHIASDLTTQHSVTLTELTAYTTYHFRVESEDAAGNGPVLSEDQQFTTDLTLSMYLTNGWDAFAQSDWETARENFLAAQIANPTSAEAYWGEGWTELYGGYFIVAVTAFDAALEIDPSCVDALAGRALAAMETGDHYQAIPDAWTVLLQDPDYSFQHQMGITYGSLHAVLARAHYTCGDYTSAQAQVDILFPANVLDPYAGVYVTELGRAINTLYDQWVYGEAGHGTRNPTEPIEIP